VYNTACTCMHMHSVYTLVKKVQSCVVNLGHDPYMSQAVSVTGGDRPLLMQLSLLTCTVCYGCAGVRSDAVTL
jgi:hypothetical protein